LKKAYESVEDIDLFAGLTLEKKFEDALIGETFICLIADVFARLRFGDRFFYDLEGKEEMTSIRELKIIHLKDPQCAVPSSEQRFTKNLRFQSPNYFI
jgi:peroxidase